MASVLGQNADAAYPVVIDGPPPGRDIPNGLVLGGFAFDNGKRGSELGATGEAPPAAPRLGARSATRAAPHSPQEDGQRA